MSALSLKTDEKSKKILVRLKGLEKSVPSNIRKSLYSCGKKLRSTASANILKRGRSGRVYRFKGRRHVSSVPGESWANRSGKRRRGIIYRVVGHNKLIFGNTELVAKFLEFGTKKMKPRPAHLISIKQNNKNILNYLDDSVNMPLTGK